MATTTSHRSTTTTAASAAAAQSSATNNNSNSTVALSQHQPQHQHRGSLLSLHRPRGAVATTASLLRHRRWGMCVVTFVGLLLILYQVMEVYWWRGFNIHDTEIDWDRGRTVTRRRPELLTTIEQSSDGSTTVRTNTPMDGILEGHLTLIDIALPTSSVWSALSQSTAAAAATASSYTGIQATFCHVSWNMQQKGDNDNDIVFPTMLSLQKASILCPSTTLTVDLAEIVSRVRQHDANRAMFSLYTPPTAVIFHESKCGSTVVSNALTAFRPTETRVYSEAAALTKALLACSTSSSSSSCNDDAAAQAHQQLIRDVFYLLGRRGESSSQAVSAASITSATAPTRRVFYKLSSASVQAMDAFVEAMPSTPWIYVYRDSVEVLMSHFAHYQQPNEAKVAAVAAAVAKSARPPECLQGFGATTTSTSLAQPNTNTTYNHAATMVALAQAADKSLADLTDVEYCAAYLAALCTAAIRQHNNTKDNIRPLDAAATTMEDSAAATTTGHNANSGSSAAFAPRWFINYNQLPFFVWETLLPQLLVGSAHLVTADEIQHMKRATRYHSHAAATAAAGSTKDKAATATQPWKEDVTLKQGQAPLSLQEAAQVFMDPVYAEMERIRTTSTSTGTMASAGHGG